MGQDDADAVRVIVVEDDSWMRESIEHALGWPNTGLTLAGSAGSGTEALALLKRGIDAQVALVDMGLPDMPGTDVIRMIRASTPTITPIVFTAHDDPSLVLEAIAAGAQGYLSKSTPVQGVLDGLLSASRGGSPITPSIARHLVDQLQDGVPKRDSSDLDSLTKREQDVLRLLAKGLTYARPAEVLGIAVGTVQGHVKRIYEKLQINSKAEAAVLAQRMGLL